MTKEQLADLVADMRAKQRFEYLYPGRYKYECMKAEQEVDEAVKNIHMGKW